jgi:hypothetical protein
VKADFRLLVRFLFLSLNFRGNGLALLGADLGEVYFNKYQKVQKKGRAPKATNEIRVALICIAIGEHFYRNLSCPAD